MVGAFHLQAKECLAEAISYSNNDLSHIMLGKIYLAENNLDMAIDVYKKAIE
jgi:tetratricopeptide (TPR) repeat protein